MCWTVGWFYSPPVWCMRLHAEEMQRGDVARVSKEEAAISPTVFIHSGRVRTVAGLLAEHNLTAPSYP